MWKMVNRELRTNLSLYTSVRGLIIMICAISYPFINGTGSMFYYLVMFGGIASVAFTEMESRDKVYISLLSSPCKRSDYVFGKFISNIIWVGIITIVGVILNMMFSVMAPAKCLPISAGEIKIVVSYMLIFTGIYYLLYFSFGLKWAKIGYYVVFVGIAFGVIWLQNIVTRKNTSQIVNVIYTFVDQNSAINNFILVIIVGSIIALLAYISFIFYDRKDF